MTKSPMRPASRRARTAGLLSLLGLLGLAAPSAQADVVERVVAVVNDQAIWLSEVRRRAAPYVPQIMAASSQAERVALREQLYTQVLDGLIDEELIRQAATRMRVRVSSEDVERAIANVRRQNNLGEAEFWEAVRGQGFSPAQYRDDLRRQLLRLKVLNQRARGRVNITEEDVRARYDEEVRRSNRTLRFRASHVFVELPAGASASDVAAVRERAEELRSQLTARNFQDAIAEFGGGELGWLRQGDLPEDLEQELLAMTPGRISSVVRGPNGYHIFLLHEREQGQADVPDYEDVREHIFRQMLDTAMARQEQLFLTELRRSALIERRI
ncbi:MAG: SurA N-terminal domain-containing protein [Sandaracinaceae bacterium]|nr:SurA N-terminal domain-containing protein [Myxococcales bacterium]MCB9658575.1 SurA N-terminal domain-containing protein [Sandaracinaceae bacterium]